MTPNDIAASLVREHSRLVQRSRRHGLPWLLLRLAACVFTGWLLACWSLTWGPL